MLIPAVEHLRGFPTVKGLGIILAEHPISGKAIIYKCDCVLEGYALILDTIENTTRVDIEDLTKLSSVWHLNYLTFRTEADWVFEYTQLLTDFNDSVLGKRARLESAVYMVSNKRTGEYLIGHTKNPTRCKRTVLKNLKNGYDHRSRYMASLSKDDWEIDFTYTEDENSAAIIYADWLQKCKEDTACIHRTDMTAIGAVTPVRADSWVTVEGVTYPTRSMVARAYEMSPLDVTERILSTDPVWDEWHFTIKK